MSAMLPRLLLAALCSLPAFAAVTGIEVIDRTDAGPGYERVRGKASFTLDPTLPQNQLIRDLQYAPRNAKGHVEFQADFEVVKPWDPAKGNGTLVFDIVNRGGRVTPGTFDENWLISQGFTLAWLGWQPDLPADGANLLRLYVPKAKGVKGVVRSELRPEKRVTVMNLGDRTHQGYPVSDPNMIQLTVRDSALGTRIAVPNAAWKLNAAATQIEMAAGFEPGRIYEALYVSTDPWIIGLGNAALRDFSSFLTRTGSGTLTLGDQRRFLKRSIGFGTSQSGRFLRNFIYQGFNQDEGGRKVFDGVWANVAGAGRGSFNHRMAQPSRDGHASFNFFYPTDLYPFTDIPVQDPVTKASDGIFVKALAANVTPKVFYTNGSYEYFGRAASLIHTTPDGQADAFIAPYTRIYFLAGTQHGPQSFPPVQGPLQKYLRNSVDYRPLLRALLIAMHEWVKDGTPPPPSSYPRIDKGELAPRAAMRFPAGLDVPQRTQMAYRADYGPKFFSEGIIDKEPPLLGQPFTVLLPQVDDDGNEIVGIKMPQVALPLATYTGWNPPVASLNMPGDTYAMVGATIPFPKAKIVEKYGTKEKYLARTREAIADLVARRLLLATDAAKLAEQAAAQWDWFMQN
jgi:hypothetical protein